MVVTKNIEHLNYPTIRNASVAARLRYLHTPG